MNASNITFEAHFHAALHYEILARLDLGRDAANLYRKAGLFGPRWVKPLLAAYREAPGRIRMQVYPLGFTDEGEYFEGLQHPHGEGWAHEDNVPMQMLLIEAYEALRPRFRKRWQAGEAAREQRIAEICSFVRGPLSTVRAALAELSGRPVPPLRIWHCPALARDGWTYGRASQLDESRVVAVGFDASLEAVFLQVMHEETHPATDPPIRKRFSGLQQDTTAGSRGFELHAALERRVVDVGQELVDAHAPEMRAAYARWRAHYRV